MKISDFRLAEYFIRKFCRSYNLNFVDLEIEFNTEEESFIHEGRIYVGETDSFAKTLFHIVATYLSHAETLGESQAFVADKDKTQYITSFVSLVRDMTYNSTSYKVSRLEGETFLNRQPLPFVLLRDIVCPAFGIPIRNVRIKALKSPYVDGAKWLEKDSVQSSAPDEFPMLVLNLDIENDAYRQAFLFVEGIKAVGLEPVTVIHEIFSKNEIRQQFNGLLRLSLVEEDSINNFLTIVSALTNYSITPTTLQAASGKSVKTANGQTWWYLGLIEKLLEPARGPDWSHYQKLEEANQELWEKIEAEKVKRGLDPLPLEALLRVQSEEFAQRPDLTIQALLADNRVW